MVDKGKVFESSLIKAAATSDAIGEICHHPDLPMSWSLLDVTAKVGINVTRIDNGIIDTRTMNNTHHHNAGLLALPLNVK